MTDAQKKALKGRYWLRACLMEIASDPTGNSTFQAQLAAQGLAGKYKAPRS
jgi:hypothetical protein